MIEKVDINNFGCFSNFSWNAEVRDKANNVCKFKKLNIIYGRNYSGKTTFSRILRSLETGEISSRYSEPSFSLSLTTGVVNQTQIPAEGQEIRVYNKDFVDEHLSFLRDEEGHISPFAILGSENAAIEVEIEKLEKELGKPEDGRGLRHDFQERKKEFNEKNRVAEGLKKEVDKKLFDKANKKPTGIKHNALYRDVNYDVRKLSLDILAVKKQNIEPLDETQRAAKITLLTEVSLPDITKKISFSPTLTSLITLGGKLVEKKIKPSVAIQDLLNDTLLQGWVKSGIQLHKDLRTTCAFCGSVIPSELWKKLGEHFSQESQDLEKSIDEELSKINSEILRLNNLVVPEKKDFYSEFQADFDLLKSEFDKEMENYKNSLAMIEAALNVRKSDIFTERESINVSDNSSFFLEKITLLNNLAEKNNEATASLSSKQNTARNQVRLSEIAQFILDIDLNGEEKKIQDLQEEALHIKKQMDAVEAEGKKRIAKINDLKTQLRDERRGAERVNQYLCHYLGHSGLRLMAVEEVGATAYRFQIMRGDGVAYNLSEGECSLVAFCYFLAKLDDIDTSGKNLIVYIDDPISSLDSNHIFFIYSLIESYLARPLEDDKGQVILDKDDKFIYRYEQMFISTHNLEFLKYLKRLSKPKGNNESFLIMKKQNSSVINLMPEYLRNYVTELTYLFDEIYCCSNVERATTHHHSFYNFGNNLRKFLEAFLFFKYPFFNSERNDYDKRIKLFFGDGTNAAVFIQRLMNEFSHLGEFIDRGAQPLDCAEIESVAKFVLLKIKENDSEQYVHFLSSIGKPDPLPS